jgi:hypothetical protein
MNAREFLVTTVHEIAIATEFAITARAPEEADTDALTNRPALDAGAKSIEPPDHLVPRDARPADWKEAFHRAGIRVADPGRLDANAHLTGARIDQRFHYGCEFSRFCYLDCFIRCAHIACFRAVAPPVGVSVRPGPEFSLPANVALRVVSSPGFANSERCGLTISRSPLCPVT